MVRDVAEGDGLEFDDLLLDLVRRVGRRRHQLFVQILKPPGKGAPVGHRQRPVKLGLRFSTKESRPSR